MHLLRLSYTIEGPDVYVAPELFHNNGRRVPPAQVRAGALDQFLQLAAAIHQGLADTTETVGGDVPHDQCPVVRASFEQIVLPDATELAGFLFPDAVSQLMVQQSDVSHMEFHCDPRLNVIPWEAAYFRGEFIGFRYATARWILADNAPMPAPLDPATRPARATLIADPEACLEPQTSESVNELLRSFGESDLVRGRIHFPPNWQQVRQGLDPEGMRDILRNQDLVFLLAHHQDSAGFKITDGQIFTPEDLANGFAGHHQVPWFLGGIGCSSGLTTGWDKDWPDCQKIYGFADAARRAGIAHYLGTLTHIPEVTSKRMMDAVTRALAEGYTMGEAVRRGRVAFRGESSNDSRNGGTAVGLAFLLYGNPRDALNSAAGVRTWNQGTRLCGHEEAGRRCLRVVSSAEPDFHDSLCVHHAISPVCSGGHRVRRSELLRCTADDGKCSGTYCHHCYNFHLQSCWRHFSDTGKQIHGPQGRQCTDPDSRHPGQPRMVAATDTAGWIYVMRGKMEVLCSKCLQATTRSS